MKYIIKELQTVKMGSIYDMVSPEFKFSNFVSFRVKIEDFSEYWEKNLS